MIHKQKTYQNVLVGYQKIIKKIKNLILFQKLH